MLFLVLIKAVICVVLLVFNRHPATRYLVVLLLLMMVLNVNMAVFQLGGPPLLALILFNHSFPLSLLHGPLLYFYVRNTLDDSIRLRRTDAIHFLPALIVLADFMPYILTPFAEKQQIIAQILANPDQMPVFNRGWRLSNLHLHLLRLVSWFGYLVAITLRLYRHRPGRRYYVQRLSYHYLITYRWLVGLSVGIFLILITYLLLIIDVPMTQNATGKGNFMASPFFIPNIFLYATVLLSILIYPQVLYGMPRPLRSLPDTLSETAIAPVADNNNPAKSEKLKRTDLAATSETKAGADPLSELADAIEAYMIKEKPYLDPEFSIATICQHFRVPQHHVYYCFSNLLKIGFPAYRNKLRVEHAKKLLEETTNHEKTMEALGLESGFSSRAIFYAAFKKESGLTPREYHWQFHRNDADDSGMEEGKAS